jgi:AraC-like DNA-binding protein
MHGARVDVIQARNRSLESCATNLVETGDAAALRLLRKYLLVVADDEALTTPAHQRIITGHFYDLAALALTSTSEGRLSESGSVRAVRLTAIKADIVANPHDGNLTAGMVATRNRMTVRYLHKLFENEAVTYSEFVPGLRLVRAYTILRNPLYARRGIGTIAFEVGFNDLSYFNRTFRWRYHATPPKLRNRHRDQIIRDQFYDVARAASRSKAQ